jgi:hypothetical protein
LDVHKDEIGPLLRYGGERLLAVLRFRDLNSRWGRAYRG